MIIEWLSASAIEDQPAINGAIDSSNAFLRPYASMSGTEANDPIGVAAECMEAVKAETKIEFTEFHSPFLFLNFKSETFTKLNFNV